MDWLLGLLAPSPSRQELLPVIGALAETLLPAEPDRAAAAKNKGDTDLANFHNISGKQQSDQMQEVTLAKQWSCQHQMPRVDAANIFDSMQVIDRIDRNLTPESKKELYLYVPLPSLTQNSTYLLFARSHVCMYCKLCHKSSCDDDIVSMVLEWQL